MEVESGNTFINIIMEMEMLECVISELYKTYARKIPQDYQFWMQLSKEEEEHTRLVRDMGAEFKQENISFSEDRFKINAVQTTIKYIQKKINQASEGSITRQNAYNIAWDIESGLLEKEFFKTFKSDKPHFVKILNKLYIDTQKHRDKIKQRKDE